MHALIHFNEKLQHRSITGVASYYFNELIGDLIKGSKIKVFRETGNLLKYLAY
jgi:hypothetical protein